MKAVNTYLILGLTCFCASGVFGEIKNVERFESIVTNRIVCSMRLKNALGWAKQAERETGATNREIADALNEFLLKNMYAEAHSAKEIECAMAIWTLENIADDDQLEVMRSLAENKAITNGVPHAAAGSYYMRMAESGNGMPFVRRILSGPDDFASRKGAVISAIRRYREKHPDDVKHNEAIEKLKEEESKAGRKLNLL